MTVAGLSFLRVVHLTCTLFLATGGNGRASGSAPSQQPLPGQPDGVPGVGQMSRDGDFLEPLAETRATIEPAHLPEGRSTSSTAPAPRDAGGKQQGVLSGTTTTPETRQARQMIAAARKKAERDWGGAMVSRMKDTRAMTDKRSAYYAKLGVEGTRTGIQTPVIAPPSRGLYTSTIPWRVEQVRRAHREPFEVVRSGIERTPRNLNTLTSLQEDATKLWWRRNTNVDLASTTNLAKIAWDKAEKDWGGAMVLSMNFRGDELDLDLEDGSRRAQRTSTTTAVWTRSAREERDRKERSMKKAFRKVRKEQSDIVMQPLREEAAGAERRDEARPALPDYVVDQLIYLAAALGLDPVEGSSTDAEACSGTRCISGLLSRILYKARTVGNTLWPLVWSAITGLANKLVRKAFAGVEMTNAQQLRSRVQINAVLRLEPPKYAENLIAKAEALEQRGVRPVLNNAGNSPPDAQEQYDRNNVQNEDVGVQGVAMLLARDNRMATALGPVRNYSPRDMDAVLVSRRVYDRAYWHVDSCPVRELPTTRARVREAPPSPSRATVALFGLGELFAPRIVGENSRYNEEKGFGAAARPRAAKAVVPALQGGGRPALQDRPKYTIRQKERNKVVQHFLQQLATQTYPQVETVIKAFDATEAVIYRSGEKHGAWHRTQEDNGKARLVLEVELVQ
ncbi:unnamed protein product [Amoebophrya sp. A120]|nr:unnamed protein product [Amoebophrya sp. A120]|eukprot:GSA120T00015716001.1